MHLIIIIGILFLIIILPLIRCILFHPFKTIIYSIRDIYYYFRYLRWHEYNKYGTITVFSGEFGKGKTLSCTYMARRIYKKYNGKNVYDFKEKKWKTQYIHVVSNVDFTDIPYIHLNQMSDLITLSEDNDGVSTYLVVIDEMATQINSRDYKTNFSTDLLNTLLASRHYRIQIFGTSVRYNLIDKLVRDVTQTSVQCHKIWRIVILSYFDGWTVENTSDVTKLKPKFIRTYFVRNKDYNAYDTVACVENFKDNVKAGKHLTDSEIMQFRQSAEDLNITTSMKKRYRKKTV